MTGGSVAVGGNSAAAGLGDAHALHHLLHGVRGRDQRVFPGIGCVLRLFNVVVHGNTHRMLNVSAAIDVDRVTIHNADLGIVQ